MRSCFCLVVSWRRWRLVEMTQASASARVPSHCTKSPRVKAWPQALPAAYPIPSVKDHSLVETNGLKDALRRDVPLEYFESAAFDHGEHIGEWVSNEAEEVRFGFGVDEVKHSSSSLR